MAKILIVDDNSEFRNLLALSLSQRDHIVTQVANGNEALRLAGQAKFDVVISDVVMPERDGIEVLMQLRSVNPSLPIIIMSGDSPKLSDLYLKIAQQLQATHVLKKPFKIEAMNAAIDAALSQGRGSRGGSS